MVRFESTDSWSDYIIGALYRGPCHQCGGRGATKGLAADGGPACQHLWIIWTKIVYLAFLKCYQCFLCAFVSPPNRTPLPPKQHVPLGNTQLQQNKAKLTQKPPATFHPHLFFFLLRLSTSRNAQPLNTNNRVIQTSSLEGNTELLFVGICCFSSLWRKTSLPAVLNWFVCLLLPTQKTRLLSIKLNIHLYRLNCSVQWVTQACGKNLWLKALTLSW